MPKTTNAKAIKRPIAPPSGSGAEAAGEIKPETRDFYCHALTALGESGVPFLVGGGYAYERYVGIARHTKDFDLFVRPADAPRVLKRLREIGFHTDLTFPHWLGKAFCGDDFVDVIFSSGNGTCTVDDDWFRHGVDDEVFGLPVKLVPPEEMIWQKGMIQERERYDGADVAHLLRGTAPRLDWARLIARFGSHWRILLGHLVLFGYVYPFERHLIPRAVMDELLERLRVEMVAPTADEQVCYGTVISREQYLTDVAIWGFQDGRLPPHGQMTEDQIAHWTAAIDRK
jgi:hypothetical protein